MLHILYILCCSNTRTFYWLMRLLMIIYFGLVILCFHCVLVGVGKSCLLLQFTDKRFQPVHDLTIGHYVPLCFEFMQKFLNAVIFYVKTALFSKNQTPSLVVLGHLCQLQFMFKEIKLLHIFILYFCHCCLPVFKIADDFLCAKKIDDIGNCFYSKGNCI